MKLSSPKSHWPRDYVFPSIEGTGTGAKAWWEPVLKQVQEHLRLNEAEWSEQVVKIQISRSPEANIKNIPKHKNQKGSKQLRPDPLHHIKLGNKIATAHRKAITAFSSHVCRSSFFGRMPGTFSPGGWKQQAASTPIEPVPQCSHAKWKENQMYTFCCMRYIFTSRYCP